MKTTLLLAACVLVGACDRAPLSSFGPPTRPTPVSTAPPPLSAAPPVVAGDTPASSVLVLSNLKAERPVSAGVVQSGVNFTLTEVSTASGAWIRSIDVVPDTGTSELGCVAWRDFRIAPGEIWHSSRLADCPPYGVSGTLPSRLTVTVTYTDDAGHAGMVEGVINLIP
jgi:hypothetical protein